MYQAWISFHPSAKWRIREGLSSFPCYHQPMSAFADLLIINLKKLGKFLALPFACLPVQPSCFTTEWVLNKQGPRLWNIWLSSGWIFSLLFTSLDRRVHLTARSGEVSLMVHHIPALGRRRDGRYTTLLSSLGSEELIGCLLAMSSWAICLTSLVSHFIICQKGIKIIASSWNSYKV